MPPPSTSPKKKPRKIVPKPTKAASPKKANVAPETSTGTATANNKRSDGVDARPWTSWKGKPEKLILEWLQIPGNYLTYKCANEGGAKGKTKKDICVAIALFLSKRGVNDRKWDMVKCKLTSLERGWREANRILNQTGEGDEQNLDRNGKLQVVTIKEKVLRKCKNWDVLDPIFFERPGNVPPYVSNSTDAGEDVMQLMFPGTSTAPARARTPQSDEERETREKESETQAAGLDELDAVPRSAYDERLDKWLDQEAGDSDDSTELREMLDKDAAKRQKVDLSQKGSRGKQKQKDPMEVLVDLDIKRAERFESVQKAEEQKDKLNNQIQQRQLKLQEDQFQAQKEQQEKQLEMQKEELAIRRMEAENRRLELQLQLARTQSTGHM